MSRRDKKVPKLSYTPHPSKTASLAEAPTIFKRLPRAPVLHTDDNHCSPSWMLSSLDLDGPWGWRGVDGETLMALRARLSSFESMLWYAILKVRHTHSMPVRDLEPEAQARLQELKIDDVETLFQLGDGNKPRIWGVRHGRVFSLLWYDPEHTVYKVEKKRT